MPMWLVWLSPLPIATLGAIAWTVWAGRRRGPERTEDTVQAYERFRAALSTPAPPPPAHAGPVRPETLPADDRPSGRGTLSADDHPAGSGTSLRD